MKNIFICIFLRFKKCSFVIICLEILRIYRLSWCYRWIHGTLNRSSYKKIYFNLFCLVVKFSLSRFNVFFTFESYFAEKNRLIFHKEHQMSLCRCQIPTYLTALQSLNFAFYIYFNIRFKSASLNWKVFYFFFDSPYLQPHIRKKT